MKKMKKFVTMMLVAVFAILSFAGSPTKAASRAEPTSYVNIKEGIYEFHSALNSSMVLDVYGGGTKNGINVALYTSHKGENQRFRVEKVRDGWYKIGSIQSDKVLDVAGGKKGKAVNIQMYSYNGSDAQLWRFYPADNNGHYFIKNKLGYYIDISGGKAKQGSNIHVYSYHAGKAQQWTLKKISDGVLDWTSVRKQYKDKSYWNGTYKGKASQCHGFALLVASKVTGSDPLSWKKAYNLNSLKAGDVVRFQRAKGPHTILITAVSGNTITYVDCNWYAKNTVKWDNTISKNKLTSKFGVLQYVLVRP